MNDDTPKINKDIIIQGDAINVLKAMPDGCVDCCITSPPYYGLRDYGELAQIGLEASPHEYIERLVNVFREIRRVLKDDGTLWIVIGDSYAGSRKGGATNPDNASHYKQGSNRGMIGQSKCTTVGWSNCKPKDMIGIPWMLAFALRDDGWYLRQDVIWQKPNPMPESVTDRCTSAHEYIFLLSKSRHYYYDQEAIKEPTIQGDSTIRNRMNPSNKLNKTPGRTLIHGLTRNDYATKNKRSVWKVPTVPYKEAHFAVFPPDLIKPCILAGCPAGGIVLDPFFGSGTTGETAIKLDRHYVGIELNPDYIKIAEDRVWPLKAQVRMEL